MCVLNLEFILALFSTGSTFKQNENDFIQDLVIIFGNTWTRYVCHISTFGDPYAHKRSRIF